MFRGRAVVETHPRQLVALIVVEKRNARTGTRRRDAYLAGIRRRRPCLKGHVKYRNCLPGICIDSEGKNVIGPHRERGIVAVRNAWENTSRIYRSAYRALCGQLKRRDASNEEAESRANHYLSFSRSEHSLANKNWRADRHRLFGALILILFVINVGFRSVDDFTNEKRHNLLGTDELVRFITAIVDESATKISWLTTGAGEMSALNPNKRKVQSTGGACRYLPLSGPSGRSRNRRKVSLPSRINVLAQLSRWPVFEWPPTAGLGCPPRITLPFGRLSGFK
jgi:hypothetical protein